MISIISELINCFNSRHFYWIDNKFGFIYFPSNTCILPSSHLAPLGPFIKQFQRRNKIRKQIFSFLPFSDHFFLPFCCLLNLFIATQQFLKALLKKLNIVDPKHVFTIFFALINYFITFWVFRREREERMDVDDEALMRY